MLDEFPTEIATVYPQKPPTELEGFFSEAEQPAIAPASGAVGTVPADRSWRGALPRVVFIAAAVMATPALLTRDSGPSAASVGGDVILVPSTFGIETSERSIEASVSSEDVPEVAVIPEAPVSGPDRELVRAEPPLSRPPMSRAPGATFVAPPEPLRLEPEASGLEPPPRADVVLVETESVAPIGVEQVAEIPSRIAPREDLNDEAAIRGILQRYEAAYERLDAAAAQDIWPSVDQRALATAFAGLETQSITFDACRIVVAVEKAIASCNGRATYVGRIGSRTRQSHSHNWTFQLRKSGEIWQIDSVQFK